MVANQELFNRILHAVQSIGNQYMFEPVNDYVASVIEDRICGYIQPIQDGKEIKTFTVEVIAKPDEKIITIGVEYKEPNLAQKVAIGMKIGPVITKEDRFNRAMKGV